MKMNYKKKQKLVSKRKFYKCGCWIVETKKICKKMKQLRRYEKETEKRIKRRKKHTSILNDFLKAFRGCRFLYKRISSARVYKLRKKGK